MTRREIAVTIKRTLGTTCASIAVVLSAIICVVTTGHAGIDGVVIERSKDGNLIVNVVDLLYTAQDSSSRSDFKGKTVELIGQFMPATTDKSHGNRFKLVRMFMGDDNYKPMPVEILIESPTKPACAKMSWIKLVGTADFPVEGGRMIALVKATKVEVIDPPKETVLY